jgi:hypothetical protein
MLSWRVGRVKITRIVEMDLPVPLRAMPQGTSAELRKSASLYPHFVGDDDTLKLSIHALLVEAPGLKLVVDICIGNDRPREITGDEPLATPFLEHLGEAGWLRDGVDAFPRNCQKRPIHYRTGVCRMCRERESNSRHQVFQNGSACASRISSVLYVCGDSASALMPLPLPQGIADLELDAAAF